MRFAECAFYATLRQEPRALHLHGAGGSLLRAKCTYAVLSIVIGNVGVAPYPPFTIT